MRSCLLALALLLLPAPALAGAKEKVAAMAPSALVLVMDDKGNELVAQNADQPFVRPPSPRSSPRGWRWRCWAATTASRPASTLTATASFTSGAAATPF